ncbi:hypothetical protein D3C72_1624980 [compost metagenome]
MSLAIASAPLSAAQARAASIGYLARAYTGKRLPLQVLLSAAGHYIGTADLEGYRVSPSSISARSRRQTSPWRRVAGNSGLIPDPSHLERCHKRVFAPRRA